MKTIKLTENALFLSLAIVLSFIKIYEMPMGGSITLCSMLPVMFSGIKHGNKVGLSVAFFFSIYQLFSAIISGNVFVWCKTANTVLFVVFFDYILPFTSLGLCGILKKLSFRNIPNLGLYAGICLSIFFRFVCHFITGVVLWSQWVENMNAYMYSLLYNASYLLPELILTLIIAVILLRFSTFEKFLNIQI